MSALDGGFADFRIWADNGDGVAAASEMLSLEQAGIASISLSSRHVNRIVDIGDVVAGSRLGQARGAGPVGPDPEDAVLQSAAVAIPDE